MKPQTLVKLAKGFLGVLFAIIMVGAMFPALGLFAATGLILSSATAAATIEGAVTTETLDTASANLLRPEISKLITKIRRDIYPLDTIMREQGKVVKINSNVWKFYSKDERGIKDTTNGAYTYAGALSAAIGVDAVQNWAVGDVALLPGITSGDGKKLRVMVSSVDIPNAKLTLSPINGRDAAGTALGNLMPSVGDESYIVRIGNAHGETDAQTTPIEIAPYDSFNYAQVFMAQVEESLTAKKSLKEVDLNIMDYKEDAIIDMRAQAELAMLFGYPVENFYDPVQRKKVNLVGGALHYITKNKEYTKATAITNAIFNSWAKYIFTGNNGSDRRILFAGNGLLERMMNADVVTKQLIGGNAIEMVAGVKFTRIATAFGELLIRRHQAFDEMMLTSTTGYTDNGLVLDMQHIERGIFDPTEVKDLNLDDTGQKRVDAKRIRESWSMAFKNPDTHCWILGV